MIKFEHKGNFNNTWNFLKAPHKRHIETVLRAHADEGVRALAAATPKDTGQTAQSWSYEISVTRTHATVYFKNTSKTKTGVPIVVLLQYGHATGTGGYVEGRDFINPALKPIFDRIAENAWREVTQL